jgi:osmotically-inducible protein OsmY
MPSDRDLQADVIEELDFDPAVDAAHIGVTAKNGVITLSGHVGSYAEKLAAEAAARRVKGVLAIAEEIEVRLPSNKKLADDQIAARALDVLRWTMGTVQPPLAVKVEHGMVTLEGELDWYYQRTRAADAVRRLSGVVGVIDRIRLRPRARPDDVRSSITRAFQRAAELDAGGVNVAIEGGKVVLSGRVRAWHEREAAERAAWSVPGVQEVEDRLSVGP